MTNDEKTQLLAQAEETHQRVLEKLAPYGVVAIEQRHDLVTLVYGDGYRWTKTERELLYCASKDLIPRRPGALN